MINVLTLRSEIADLLTGQIGTYTFKNGLSTPAIRVEPSHYPEEPKVSGLEVVISVESSLQVSPRLFNDRLVEAVSTVTLKQWDVENTTQSARQSLIRYLDGVINVQVVPRATFLDNIETCTLTVEQSFAYWGTSIIEPEPGPEDGITIPFIIAATGF